MSVRPTRLPGCGCVAAGVCGRLWGTVGPFPVPSCLHLPTTRTCLAFLICTAQGGSGRPGLARARVLRLKMLN